MKCRRCGKVLLRGIGTRFALRETIRLAQDTITYKAWDNEGGRPVIVRLLRNEASAHAKQRFHAEARLLHRIGAGAPFPALVKGGVHHPSGLVFAAYECLEGKAMGVAARGLSPVRICELAIAMARTVQRLHETNLVHGCLHPNHFLLGEGDQVMLIDFRFTRPPGSESQGLGIQEFKAPEQFRGAAPVTAATDVFALAVIVYTWLTGRPPYPRRTLAKPGYVPPRPSELNLDSLTAVDDILLQALDRNPGRRFPDAGAFADALWSVTGHVTEIDITDTPWASSWRVSQFVHSVYAGLLSTATAPLRFSLRRPFLCAFICMPLLVGGVTVWMTPSRPPLNSAVQFLSWPPAELKVNQVPLGKTPSPIAHELRSGRHTVEIQRDGMEPFHFEIFLVPGEHRVVKVDLERREVLQ